ncbi:hypothetical protein EV363DRAFT_1320371 [Boletus edulis]|uniref:Uncharacterized protein n=1 Tax=Boletus edulis BED1 TaxID=1328754 RepID=A0AAD4GJF4_BOLED|nr:hypothetical protein EV363DRAFT_1320371 [Boletus edulis]KAF8447565.1 hypothetical protein L210DRAFT_978810 [Boletus edulis BED1]
MTTTKVPAILMPHHNFESVGDLSYKTGMSYWDFRIFTATVRLNTLKYLDSSGFVPVERQDPVAFRQFLDEVKMSEPTIAKRYPYLWPVLAYLELYLDGRRRSHLYRNPYATTKPPVRNKFSHRVPIYMRYSRSVKTGQPLREIAEVESDRLSYRLSRSAYCRAKRPRTTVKNYRKRRLVVTDSDADESGLAVVIDSNNDNAVGGYTPPPPEPANKPADPVKSFWWSLGTSIGGICAHVVGG